MYTNSAAVSSRMPVGRPDASRRISPPGGFPVADVMPASSSARLFTQVAWRLLSSRATGCPGVTASRSAAVGKDGSGQRFLFHPPPWIQRPGGVRRASAATRAIASFLVGTLSRSTWPWCVAILYQPKWTCASMRPGMTVRLCRSMACPPRRSMGRNSASSPTARMRLPATATAWALGLSASMV